MVETPFRLVALDQKHFGELAALAERIWRQHYTPILGDAQVEHMLRGRYAPERLCAYVGSSERWLELLFLGEAMVGFCSYALDGEGGMKLEQLYVDESARGRGLGRGMLEHVEAIARRHGCRRVWLTVNRKNVGSIAVYERSGYTIEREVVFDIGDGFVMDDYAMHKALGPT